METRLPEMTAGAVPHPGSEPVIAPNLKLPRYRSRYSRFVLLMKLALPLIAGIVVVLVVLWPELTSEPDRFRIGISDLRVETAGGQRVVNARFTGVDQANRPYSVTADSVVQVADSRGRFDLQQPKADITLQDSTWIAITSPAGVYWRNRETLDLTGGVNVFHDLGYEFRTPVAQIDFRKGTAAGNKPVSGQGPFGTIAAEGFRVESNGDRVLFTGKARLVLYPENPPKGEGG